MGRMRWIILTVLFCFGPARGQVYETGFVVTDGVFNSELMAPFDILEHSRYRNPNRYFRCFLVSPDGRPIHTAEGLQIEVDTSFEDCPPLDVVVIPSSETSMTSDLQDRDLVTWVKAQAESASAVLTLCDGAFLLAQTGLLDGRHATTFPGDQNAFAQRFPRTTVHRDTWFIRDGRFITSVGGARSYEPAIFLTELWFGREDAVRTAQGLVISWPIDSDLYREYGGPPDRPVPK